MLRTIGFIIGLGLASVGLLFLLDVSLALQVREAAVSHVRRLADPLLGEDWQREEPLPIEQSALPPRMRASDRTPVASSSGGTPKPAGATEVAAATSPAGTPDPSSEVDALLDALSEGTNEAEARPAPAEGSRSDTGEVASRAAPGIAPPAKSETVTVQPESPMEPEPQWYAFWSPFRTEGAANGFATRLSNLTGLEFTVLSPSPGEYHVAFAYRDETEKRQAMEAIERQAGLDVTGTGSP